MAEILKIKILFIIGYRSNFFWILAGGVAAYRATPSSIKFVQLWSKKCLAKGGYCDDQIILNHLYAYYLKIKWSSLPGFTGIYGKVRPAAGNNATFPIDCVIRHFLTHCAKRASNFFIELIWALLLTPPSYLTSLLLTLFFTNIMVFDPFKVVRGGQPYNCLLAKAHKPWIINPRNIHKGSRNKLGMFFVYRDCMSASRYMAELVREWTILFKINNITSRTGLRLAKEAQ